MISYPASLGSAPNPMSDLSGGAAEGESPLEDEPAWFVAYRANVETRISELENTASGLDNQLEQLRDLVASKDAQLLQITAENEKLKEQLTAPSESPQPAAPTARPAAVPRIPISRRPARAGTAPFELSSC